MALQGHIIVPTTHEQSDHVIETITAKMAVEFGGYSRYEGVGGWDNGEEVVEEDHVRLVVNTVMDDEYDRDAFKEYLTIEAEYVKDILDQDAVLIEIHDMDMDLV